MKKLFLFLIPLFIIACEKNNDINSDTNENTIKSVGCEGKPQQVLVRDFRYLGDIFCTFPCVNCYFTVTIRASDQKASNDTLEMYYTFIDYFENGNVPDFFENENYSLLFTEVDEATANDFISGEYNKTLKEKSTMDTGVNMFIFLHNSADPENYDSTDVFRVLQTKLINP